MKILTVGGLRPDASGTVLKAVPFNFMKPACFFALEEHQPQIDFLNQIGTLLLDRDQSTNWLTIEELEKECKRLGMRKDNLESFLRPLFDCSEEIYTDTLLIEGCELRIGWDLVFKVRFYKCDPSFLYDMYENCSKVYTKPESNVQADSSNHVLNI